MWRGIFIIILGVLMSAPVYAGFVIRSPNTITVTRTPTLIHAYRGVGTITLKPQITQINPAQCVHRGDAISIVGTNLGSGSGRHLALISNGSSIGSIPTSSWTQTSINATVPNLSTLKDGQQYEVAIAQNNQQSWLSNSDKGFSICAASPLVTMVSPATRHQFGLTVTNLQNSQNQTSTTTSQNPQDQTSNATQGTSPMASELGQTGGGSLLQEQFPPPPQDVQPPPLKDDNTIESHELLVLSDNLQAAQALLSQAQALGLEVKRRSVLKALGFVMTVLRVPKQSTSGKALLLLRKTLPKVWADVNHRYQLQGSQANSYGRHLIRWKERSRCNGLLRIGMLDTMVASNLPALHGRAITQHSFLAAGITPAPRNHATAIAALLLAAPQASGLDGLMPRAHLYVAGIFRDRNGEHIDTTAEWIVRGLNWLVQQHVSIVSLSLGGPRNLLVEAAIQRVLQQGVAVVAAAGNSGASGPPVYPAAQPGVLAVTAVDAQRNIYRHATRGNYIALSAPGVDIWTLAPNTPGRYVSGTSYAVPFVTAALASAHLNSPKTSWPVLERRLEKHAHDLGKPGRDRVFGWGLVQMLNCRHSPRRYR